MPRLPRVNQKQRISQGNPVAALSTTKEGAVSRRNNDILAKGLSDAGRALASMQKAQFAATVSQEKEMSSVLAARLSGEAVANVANTVSDPEKDPHGLNMLDTYKEGMQGYQDYILSLPDNEIRHNAIIAGEKVAGPAVNKILLQKAEIQNQVIAKRRGQLAAEYGMAAAANPKELFNILERAQKSSITLPFGDDNHRVATADAKDIILTSVAGMTKPSEFDQMKKNLMDPRAPNYLEADDRTEILKEIRKGKSQAISMSEQLKRMRQAEIKRAKVTQDSLNMRRGLFGLHMAKSPEEKISAQQDITDMALSGDLNFTQVNSVLAFKDNTDERISKDLEQAVTSLIVNGSSDATVEKAIIGSGPKGMLPTTANRMLKDMEASRKRVREDPQYGRDIKVAKNILKRTFNFESQDIYGNAIWDEETKPFVTEIEVLWNENMRDKKMAPIEAMIAAKAQVLGEVSNAPIPGVSEWIMNDSDALNQEKKDILNRLNVDTAAAQKTGSKLLPSTRAAAFRRMKKIDIRIKALAADAERTRITGSTQNKSPKLRSKR